MRFLIGQRVWTAYSAVLRRGRDGPTSVVHAPAPACVVSADDQAVCLALVPDLWGSGSRLIFVQPMDVFASVDACEAECRRRDKQETPDANPPDTVTG